MKTQQWQKVRQVFDAAVAKRGTNDISSFLDDACNGDPELRREVESLLASLDGADSFMETPAVNKVADAFEEETKELERGKCFAHYEIIRQIGAGGMGEVYLARDKKLERMVAVKILNEKFARHESNLKRFIKEAKAASALDHPNILVIHEFGESDGRHFIVSEYVKGVTLREFLKNNSIQLLEIFDILAQGL